MQLNSFIYSNERSDRISRHVAFWLVWFFFLFSNWAGIWSSNDISTIIHLDFYGTVNRILPVIPFCYFVIYFVIPQLRRRIWLGIIMLFISVVAFYYLQYLALTLINPYKLVDSDKLLHAVKIMPDALIKRFSLSALTNHSGGIACCAVMLSIRFLKVWYIKQQENVTLNRENAVAELQLLKAQVHPHFLFNTLNNIYSFALSKSSAAGDLIEKLSGILQYMILEGEKALVPLEKEIEMLLDYISLEEVRYGDRLDITTNVSGAIKNKFIAPLLMIPFVENAFKHGSSKLLKDPEVKLSIRVEGDTLFFELINNKPLDTDQSAKPNGKGGIGLKNARKRLELLYPGQHQLKIESTESTFSVRMKITIVEVNDSTMKTSLHRKSPFASATA
jgi:hypothetical protein